MDYFKVVREDLTSVGLLGASRVQYSIGKWVYPREPLSSHNRKGGGLWVLWQRSDALRFKRYVEQKYGFGVRIFTCAIGAILYENSYRVKTGKVMLLEEIKRETIKAVL